MPDWNGQNGLLRCGERCKHFRPDALAPRAILGAFQQAGWCESVDNPLPEDPEIRRAQLLETTVSNLNRVLKGWGIRFHDGGQRGAGAMGGGRVDNYTRKKLADC